MSAIDFDMDITRKSDPKGDRVALGMTGKFLPLNITGPRETRWRMGLRRSRCKML
jgi:cyanate lyase